MVITLGKRSLPSGGSLLSGVVTFGESLYSGVVTFGGSSLSWGRYFRGLLLSGVVTFRGSLLSVVATFGRSLLSRGRYFWEVVTFGRWLFSGGRYFWKSTELEEPTQIIAESDSVFTQSQEKKKITRRLCWYIPNKIR